MNETDITVVPSEVDVDDVEAHGIREVMVGLSAAAVLTGGVAAVVTAGDGQGGGSRSTITAGASGIDASDADLAAASSDAAGASMSTAGAVGRAAGPATSITSSTARMDAVAIDEADDVSASSTFLGRNLDRADRITDASVGVVREVSDDAVDATRTTLQITSPTVSDARTTVRNAPSTVTSSAQAVSSAAISLPTVADVVTAADRSVDATLEVVAGSVRGIEGTASTLIARLAPQVGMGLDASSASGWVTLSVGGEEIARAQVQQGQASVSYTAPRADLPITVSFTGSDLVRAPSITL
ncbi:MAG TPA: hypothetical protein VNA14_12385 [Mycobacteriales bacterium]|nr:hypothetical protein [Mycobacteriales bacterium]